jgi:hypothetical protein
MQSRISEKNNYPARSDLDAENAGIFNSDAAFVPAEIGSERTQSDLLNRHREKVAEALDEACRAFLDRRMPAWELQDAIRVLLESPPEILDSAIRYCRGRGWMCAR